MLFNKKKAEQARVLKEVMSEGLALAGNMAVQARVMHQRAQEQAVRNILAKRLEPAMTLMRAIQPD